MGQPHGSAQTGCLSQPAEGAASASGSVRGDPQDTAPKKMPRPKAPPPGFSNLMVSPLPGPPMLMRMATGPTGSQSSAAASSISVDPGSQLVVYQDPAPVTTLSTRPDLRELAANAQSTDFPEELRAHLEDIARRFGITVEEVWDTVVRIAGLRRRQYFQNRGSQ